MTDSTPRTDEPGRELLTPAARAISALALAVAGLTGQNALASGLQFLLLSNGAGSLVYALVMGLGAAVPAALALLLAGGQARRPAAGWPDHLSRAAVVVALVALAGAVLTVAGAALTPS